jgi:hypothetical protein
MGVEVGLGLGLRFGGMVVFYSYVEFMLRYCCRDVYNVAAVCIMLLWCFYNAAVVFL